MSDQENDGKTGKTMYPVTLSIRMTQEDYNEIQRIAEFERMKPTQVCRKELVSMIQRYERNPQYKRFLKQRAKTQSKGL